MELLTPNKPDGKYFEALRFWWVIMIDRFDSDEVKRLVGHLAIGWCSFPNFQQNLIRVVRIRKS